MDSYPPPNYVMLNKNQDSLRPPPYRRNVPRYQDHQKSGKSCCFRCIFCCCCYLFLLFFLSAAIFFFIFAFYKPKVPKYSVDSISIDAFHVEKDLNLFAQLAVNVKADNPNEHITFMYGEDNSVSVMYSGTNLCAGKFPGFKQPEKNVTIIKMVLKGNNEFGSGLQAALMENRHSGKIPLLVKVKVPVQVEVGILKLRKINVFVNCSLVLDNLQPDKKPRILSSSINTHVNF